MKGFCYPLSRELSHPPTPLSAFASPPTTQQPKKEKEYSEGEPETTRTITKQKKKITLSTEVGRSNKERW